MRVLFVCLGNICRSPLGEGILRHQVQTHLRLQDGDHEIIIDSAGTGDYHIGKPPDLRAREVARRHGIDIDTLRARQIGSADFDRFDFILAMDRDNLRHLRRLSPEKSRARLGLLREFDSVRGDDVPDPYYGDHDRFDEVFEIIERSCRIFLKKHAPGTGFDSRDSTASSP